MLLAGLLPATAARAGAIPGMPEPGEDSPPARANTEPDELTAKPTETREDEPSRPDQPKPGWVILPGVSYTPERGLNVAGTLMRYFRLDSGPEARPSSLALRASISLKARTEATFDPTIWLAGDRLNLAGTLGASYYDYPYYGVGNDTVVEDREDFTAGRVNARLEVVARVWQALYVGPLYDFRYEDITAVEDGGMLEMGAVGSDGGILSGIGGIIRWDTRDNSYAPHRGGLISFSPRMYRQGLGSDQDFGRLTVDASWFVSLGGEHVVAIDGRADFRSGNPPFDHLSLAGGSRLLRGMIEGRYRDNHYLAEQVEYRFPLFWRLGGVAFGGVGRVAEHVSDFKLEDWKYAGGAGLRFAIDRAERINARLDAGATVEGVNFYLAIGEAF